MSLQNDRQLYQLIADPIKTYLQRQGLDPVNNLALISGLACEVYDNLKLYLEATDSPGASESSGEHQVLRELAPIAPKDRKK